MYIADIIAKRLGIIFMEYVILGLTMLLYVTGIGLYAKKVSTKAQQ
ncbi:hypothetical protein [Sulfurimonas sp.]